MAVLGSAAALQDWERLVGTCSPLASRKGRAASPRRWFALDMENQGREKHSRGRLDSGRGGVIGRLEQSRVGGHPRVLASARQEVAVAVLP